MVLRIPDICARLVCPGARIHDNDYSISNRVSK